MKTNQQANKKQRLAWILKLKINHQRCAVCNLFQSSPVQSSPSFRLCSCFLLLCRPRLCGNTEHPCVYTKCVLLDLCALQIEVSELYFVPDAGASRDQCEAPLFKPVSAYSIPTESLVSQVMFSFKTLLTFYHTFSTNYSPWENSFLTGQ